MLFYAIIIMVLHFISYGNARFYLKKNAIVGGRIADMIPYQASIEMFVHHCGGSIISERVVLTAAHCLNGIHPKNYWIRAGTNYREKGGQRIQVADFLIHPNFDIIKMAYDIAVLYLIKPLKFDQRIQPIRMVDANESLERGTNATISGWGLPKEDADSGTSRLMIATVPIVDNETCKTFVHYVLDSMICAGFLTGDIDACTEDSGGPMVVNGRLFGIISSGIGCARRNNLGIYTSVPHTRQWIDESIETLKSNNMQEIE